MNDSYTSFISEAEEELGIKPRIPEPKVNRGLTNQVRNPKFKMELGDILADESDKGDVYHAKNDPNVVIKAPKHYNPENIDPETGESMYDQPAVDHNEIDNLKHLQNNPHAADIINHTEDKDGYDLLAMEKLKGNSATDYKDKKRPGRVWKAVSSIHKDGVAHKDLHGENMMFDPKEDIVRMLDFGESERSFQSAYKEAIQGLTGNGRSGKFEPEFQLGREDLSELEIKMRDLMLKNKEGIDSELSDSDDEEKYSDYVNRLYSGLNDLIDEDDAPSGLDAILASIKNRNFNNDD